MSVYEEAYAGRLQSIQTQIENGEYTLSRILASLERSGMSHIDQNRAQREMDLSRRSMGYAMDGQVVLSREINMADAILIHRLQVVTTLLKYLPPGTERIIELGCGTGVNLFWLWIYGGPRHADYFGMEPAESGRKCQDLLASLERNINIESVPFDYNAPDFSRFRDDKKTVVLTVHSIEQIADLNKSLLKDIYSINGFQRCIHLEPVGWQMEDTNPAFQWLDYQNKVWSILRNRYNNNMMTVLNELEADGEIKIIHTVKHLGGLHAGNANSMIVWDR